jgi:hypothetical protein
METTIFESSSFNAVFFSFLITSVIGCILKIGGMCYKSKCVEVKVCCITVKRDATLETQIDATPTQENI